ncbi:unnamed protein product [Haemonchus placei]|uniref:Uncharacterized protein n=1 Tax=Haemonchus placei TaxID=6290 RepID=A0A0N4WXZ9_HAEPC|nr:unnamed protein product [Haemonchus placei]
MWSTTSGYVSSSPSSRPSSITLKDLWSNSGPVDAHDRSVDTQCI